MNNVKMCARCNAVLISNLNNPNADYYRHLSIKYCDSCREIVKRDQAAQRVRRYRQRKKRSEAVQTRNTDLLIAENEQLEKQIALMSEQYVELVDKLQQLDAIVHNNVTLANKTADIIHTHKKRIVS